VIWRASLARLWPDTLVGRTILVVLAGVALSNLIALAVYTGERLDALTSVRGRFLAERIAEVAEALVAARPEMRPAVLRGFRTRGVRFSWSPQAPAEVGREDWRTRLIRRAFGDALNVPEDRFRVGFRTLAPGESVFRRYRQRPQETGRPPPAEGEARMVLAGTLQLDDGTWLNFVTPFPNLQPFWTSRFFLIIVTTTIIALAASVWAVRRATRPLGALAVAAQRLGTDIAAPPIAEEGPREVRLALHAFNEMQGRLQRVVHDRTQMLAAISHDLRTPITRMKLRAELVEDFEQRAKMIADLDEMEAMVAATLSFARDDPAREPLVRLDLAALLQSLCADAVACGAKARYEGPARLVFTGRATALKRAFANLIDNAVKYGGSCRVTAAERATEKGGVVVVTVEDNGPGIPETEREQVFEPFYRMETSRSRATGGVGLGLSVVRGAVRAHGGDIALANRPEGGLCATVTLPGTRLSGAGE
jgi:signal transduction histidine kinase